MLNSNPQRVTVSAPAYALKMTTILISSVGAETLTYNFLKWQNLKRLSINNVYATLLLLIKSSSGTPCVFKRISTTCFIWHLKEYFAFVIGQISQLQLIL